MYNQQNTPLTSLAATTCCTCPGSDPELIGSGYDFEYKTSSDELPL